MTTSKIDLELRLNDNPLVQHFFHIYDKVYFPKESDFIMKRFKWNPDCSTDEQDFIYFFKKHKINIGLEEALEDLQSKMPIILNSLGAKDIMWFCDFVRVAEKVIFYKNDKESSIIVDSQIEDDEKKLVIQNQDWFIKILVQTVDGFVPTTILDHGSNYILNLHVERKYGKGMENNFVVVNGETKYNDSSDLYLINSVNMILKVYIKEFFDKAVRVLVDKEIGKGWDI